MRHTNNYQNIYPDFVPPADLTPPRADLAAPQRPARPRGRRSKVGLVIFLAFLLLIGGTATAMVAYRYGRADQTVSFQRPGYDEGWSYDDPYAQPDTPTTIERAATVSDVFLTLHDTVGDSLTYQDIYEKCIPSVVSILTTAEEGGGSGTGVVLTEDGYVVTNYHVIQGGSSVEVLLHNGRRHNAKLVGGDRQNDLAVLKIEAEGLTPAEFGDSDTLRVGDDAFAIGNPLGVDLRGTMTEGIISAIDRNVNMDGYIMSLIQTSAALNPGNSGGALINRRGQVVGITNMKMMSYFETIEGLGFAIPSTTTKEIVEDLLALGHVPGRPTLGFSGYSLTAEMAQEMGDTVPGVYVSTVEPKSDAYTQGLRPGDVVTRCEGARVLTVEAINAIKAEFEPGERLSFSVYRAGAYLDMDIKLMERYQMDA